MSKQTQIKSNLSGVILVSFILLGASTLFSLSKSNKTEFSSSCTNELLGKIIQLETQEKAILVILDNKGNTYFPVLSSANTILTADQSVNICYKTIDKSNPDHKIIYVEKVVSLPSPNEKR